MMLIKRSTGPLQRAHKIMHIIFLLCCAHKKNTEKRSAAWQPCFCLCVHFCSATCFQIHELSIFCCRGYLKLTPPFHIQCSIEGRLLSSETWPGLACVLLTPDSWVDPTQPASGFWRERGICLSRRGREVGMSGWMEWWTGHVTPTLDDHVSVNVITVIITAYMMKWQKVLTRSALILTVRLNALTGLVGCSVQIILL